MAASSKPSASADSRVLPTGTVTFLFSDIEGSTKRWEQQRAAMPEALLRHEEFLRTAMEAHSGYVFKTIGDAFCAAFERVSDAVAACVDAQRALNAGDFAAVDGLRVRCALHTGESVERDGDYFGPALNRVARLMAIGHGGQILISGVTRDLAHEALPHGATFVDLGLQRLQDLTEPEHVWQLSIAGLPSEFPPLRSLEALPNNLPIQRTSFVGRAHDVADIKELLERNRLLTLVGSGGVGKTRLAIQAGAELLDRYPDGVWFVDFAPISDPELVASVVAQALGMSQQQGRRVDEAIPQWLRRKKLLLIFDNCEHILEPAAALADAILATAQDVRILATSRQGLDISGEAVHRLPSLPVPAEAAALKADEAVRYGAIALFVDRAESADTRFTLTDDSAPIVAEICRRLDGIPLAIELAAARVKVLSIPHIAQRLNERFKILTGGSRSALPRQKTLTATIDWSYDLLSPQEQLLFTRLGVFAGGFGLDAVTRVCTGDGLDEVDIFDLLASLADKSLVVADTSGGQERYRLLESTAAYALEKLNASGERQRIGRRHAEYFCDLAEATFKVGRERGDFSPQTSVDLDLDNYRAALGWALTQGNDGLLGGAIAGALSAFLWNAGLGVEERYWVELALKRVNEAEHPHVAARLHNAVGKFLSGERAYEATERAMRLFESVDDARGAAHARATLAMTLYMMGQLDEASAAIAQALTALRACGADHQVAAFLSVQANIEADRGDRRLGRELNAQALAACKNLGDKFGEAIVLTNLGELEFTDGYPEEALRCVNDALEILLRGKNAFTLAIAESNKAAYCIALGDFTEARESARESLRFAGQAQSERLVVSSLESFALLAVLGGDAQRAAGLRGYVKAQNRRLGQERTAAGKVAYDKLIAALRETLSEDDIKKLGSDGAAWSEDQAVEEALKI
jgi:predicted ATPase/class 3 adenylate cyclase